MKVRPELSAFEGLTPTQAKRLAERLHATVRFVGDDVTEWHVYGNDAIVTAYIRDGRVTSAAPF